MEAAKVSVQLAQEWLMGKTDLEKQERKTLRSALPMRTQRF